MKLKFLFAIAMIFSITVPVFAQEASLTIETSKDTYNEGEPIIVSGQVRPIIPDATVTLQVFFDEGNFIHLAQLTPAKDGSFTHTIKTESTNDGKSVWRSEGEYIIKALYGTGIISEIAFNFLKIQESSFEIKSEDATSMFDVKYTIKSGTVENMAIDEEMFALVITIDTIDDGTITIELPTDALDAKDSGCEGTDSQYIVRIDKKQSLYDEAGGIGDNRNLAIDFEKGDRKIEIIGTCVIPEFGSMAIVILAVSIISIVAVSRKSILKI